METKKIRIGNDIRLAVDLRLYINSGNYLLERKVYNPSDEEFEGLDSNIFVNKDTEVYYPNQYALQSSDSDVTIQPGDGTPVAIRSIKAYIINTSRQKEYEETLKNKTRFISRFPMEPYYDMYEPNPYNIHCSGYPGWRAYPTRHLYMPYAGFGVHPHFGGLYKRLPIVNDTEYLAHVMATKEQNVVEVSFPARAQRFTGLYKLVIVAELYAPGFNNRNLKTITVDMPNVFELVKTSEEGIDTGIMMRVGSVIDVLPAGENAGTIPNVQYDDVYVNEGTYGDNNIALSRTDGDIVNVDTSSFTSWWEE